MQIIEQTITSVEAAKWCGKKHDNLVRDIRGYVAELSLLKNEESDSQLKIQPSDFFKESTYNNGRGREYSCYLVTKKGCEFIAHKMTGIKGTEFTARYINRFHEMEEQLQKENHMDWFVNDIRVFQHKEFGILRTLKLDGQDYFIGLDATRSLGYVNNTDTLKKRVSDSEKCYVAICDGTRSRKMVAITRAGLNELIKTGRLPLASKYNEWIQRQITPALTGKEEVVPVTVKTEPLKDDFTMVRQEVEAGQDAISIFRVLIKAVEARGLKINTKDLKGYNSFLCGDRIAVKKGLTLEEVNFEMAFELFQSVVNYDHGNMIDTPLAKYYNAQAERAATMMINLLSI